MVRRRESRGLQQLQAARRQRVQGVLQEQVVDKSTQQQQQQQRRRLGLDEQEDLHKAERESNDKQRASGLDRCRVRRRRADHHRQY